ncbi:MAG: hypothetical protein FD137_1837, partial [Spirochaetes bacterium]
MVSRISSRAQGSLAAGRALGRLKRVARDPVLAVVALLTLGSLIVFVLYPLASVVDQSFRPGEGYSTSVYGEVLKSAYLR